MVGLGYGIGLPLMVFDAIQMIRHEFSAEYLMHGGIFYNAFGSLVVALGHVGLLMLIVQSGALTWLTSRLAAVGRMALSNYLTHSIVCTTLFYRLRLRPLRYDQPHGPGRDRAGDLDLPARRQPDLAAIFPLRAGRMALAVADLLAAPTDAGHPGGDRGRRGLMRKPSGEGRKDRGIACGRMGSKTVAQAPRRPSRQSASAGATRRPRAG